MPRTAGASLLELPLELVVYIAEHLPPESIAAMALTTKSLYESLRFKQMWRPKIKCKPNKLIFLLARDVPQSVLCTCCHRLHPRRDTPKLTRDWKKWQACSRSTGTWLHLDPWNYHIQFGDVYEVMNKQRGGIGADLSSIAVHTDWRVMTVGDVEALEGRADFWGDLEVSGRYLTKLDVTLFLWSRCVPLEVKLAMTLSDLRWRIGCRRRYFAKPQALESGRQSPAKQCGDQISNPEVAPQVLKRPSDGGRLEIEKCA